MSNGGSSGRSAGPEWDRLELAARRLLKEYTAARRRLGEAESRASRLEETLRQVSEGAVDPVAMQARLRRAEAENRELKARLQEADDRVKRMLARLDFLQEDR